MSEMNKFEKAVWEYFGKPSEKDAYIEMMKLFRKNKLALVRVERDGEAELAVVDSDSMKVVETFPFYD